jgi:hypothetical protein
MSGRTVLLSTLAVRSVSMDTNRRGTMLEQSAALSLEKRWVLARFGVERPQFLSSTRAWGTIATASWFAGKEAARAATCPPGTSGTAIQMEPAATP